MANGTPSAAPPPAPQRAMAAPDPDGFGLQNRRGVRSQIMQIQVSTDNHIDGREAVQKYVQSIVEDTLGRFGDRITRVEVHLSDQNADKGGEDDKRCTIEARLEGRQPMAATHDAGTLHDAVDGAAEKLKHALEHFVGRQQENNSTPPWKMGEAE
jgi:ribosome-associated translation inhibitor RaiA